MTETFNVAIVEDDLYYSKIVEKAVKNCLEEARSNKLIKDGSFSVQTFQNAADYLSSGFNYKLAILDYHLGGKYGSEDDNGETLLSATKESNPNCKVVLLSSQDRLATVAKLKSKGVDLYLMKNANSIERLQDFILSNLG